MAPLDRTFSQTDTLNQTNHPVFFLEKAGHTEHLDWKPFVNEQDEEPVIILDEEHNSDEGLTDVNETINYYSKNRLESCSHPKCMSSPTQCTAQFLERWIQSVLQTKENKAVALMESDTCKNRCDTTGETTDVEWHAHIVAEIAKATTK